MPSPTRTLALGPNQPAKVSVPLLRETHAQEEAAISECSCYSKAFIGDVFVKMSGLMQGGPLLSPLQLVKVRSVHAIGSCWTSQLGSITVTTAWQVHVWAWW